MAHHPYISSMYYKCILEINGEIINATTDLKNWDEVETALKRSGMNGVVRSYSSSFSFVGNSCWKLFRAFTNGGVRASSSVSIQLLNKNLEWEDYFDCELDMSSAKYNGTTFEVNAFDNSISAKLNAAKSTKFEFPVSELTTEKVTFDRIMMNNWGKSVITPIINDDFGTNTEYLKINSSWATLPIYVENTSIPIKRVIEIADQEQESIDWRDSTYYQKPTNKNGSGNRWSYFLYAKDNANVNIKVGFKATATYNLVSPERYYGDTKLKVGLFVFNENGYSRTIKIESITGEQMSIAGTKCHIDFTYNGMVELSKGESISLMVRVPYDDGYAQQSGSMESIFTFGSYGESLYYEASDFTIKASWQDIGQPVTFDGIRPAVLLDRIVKEICGSTSSGAIAMNGNARLANTILCPAECIRQFGEAKVYTTFNNFVNFMEAVFGYTYTIEGERVVFRHRDEIFERVVTKNIKENTDFQLSVDNSMLFSAVEIGNEKIDYDEENGLYEYNFKQTYRTGLSHTSNTLMLSPDYRLDCFGVEYLAEKIEDNTKDDDSDDDIFAIMLSGNKPDTSINVELREYVGSLAKVTTIRGAFNVKYHPRYCIEANKLYIGAFANRLEYASSAGNSDVTFNSDRVDGNIDITDKKYTPYTISFKTNDYSLPELFNGAIKLTKDDVDYHGWITSLKTNPTKEKNGNYTIMVADPSYSFEEKPEPEPVSRITIDFSAYNEIRMPDRELVATHLEYTASAPVAYNVMFEVMVENPEGDAEIVKAYLSVGESHVRKQIPLGYNEIKHITIEEQEEDDDTIYDVRF